MEPQLKAASLPRAEIFVFNIICIISASQLSKNKPSGQWIQSYRLVCSNLSDLGTLIMSRQSLKQSLVLFVGFLSFHCPAMCWQDWSGYMIFHLFFAWLVLLYKPGVLGTLLRTLALFPSGKAASLNPSLMKPITYSIDCCRYIGNGSAFLE